VNAAWVRSPAAPFVGSCVLLLAITIIEWLPSAAPPVPKPVARPAHSVASAKPAEDRDTDGWADTITERPLFTIGRRPPKVAAGHQQAGAGLPRLAGIMVSPYGKRAIFMPEGGKPLVVSEGGKVDTSTIRSIATNQVVLIGPTGETTVLVPLLDKQRAVVTGPATNTTPFLPGGMRPGFGQPGAPFQPGGFVPPAPQPADDNNNADSGDNTPPPAQPPFRPPFMRPGFGPANIPHGREQ
jgi:hypothetical protein